MEIAKYLMENLIFPLLVALIINYVEKRIDKKSKKEILLFIASYIKNHIRFFNNFSSHLWCSINFEDHSNFAIKI